MVCLAARACIKGRQPHRQGLSKAWGGHSGPRGGTCRYTGHSYRDRFYGVHNAFTTLSVTVSPLLSHTHQKKETRDKLDIFFHGMYRHKTTQIDR